jgi:amidase
VSTFITRLDPGSSRGPRLAVKDLIDLEGVPTTAGCKAVADHAKPAERDAALMAGARAADARIVGKVNLHELAFGATGVNPWFGTPVNPLDPRRVPGGSSSGSAVAVATDEADVAYGSDTGGSVRIPSACCGTAGLKTTWGRIPLDGVFLLAESLDTVGPMARDVAGLVLGMQLLEPGFAVDGAAAGSVATAGSGRPTIGRFRGLLVADEVLDTSIDRLLATAEVDVVDVDLPGWAEATEAAVTVLLAEAWRNDRYLLASDPDGIGNDVRVTMGFGEAMTGDIETAARARREPWRAELAAVFARVDAIALPTLVMWPPLLDEDGTRAVESTAAVNLAGHPALALPVPSGGPLPASIQLVGPDNSEERLLALGAVLEAAAWSLG